MTRRYACRAAYATLAALSVVALSGCGAGPLTVAAEARAGKLWTTAGQQAGQSAQGSAQAPSLHLPSLPKRGSPAGPSSQRVAPDILVTSKHSLTSSLRRIRTLPGIEASAVFGTRSATLRGRTVTVGAVRPSTYRMFSPPGTAESDGVWKAVARGEAVVAHSVARRLDLPLGGGVSLGRERMRVGAFATTVPGIDVVVGREAGKRIGVTPKSSIVISAGSQRVPRLVDKVRGVVGKAATVNVLEKRKAKPVARRSFISGEQAAKSLGSFSYRYYSDGSIQPDPDWVAANIRTAKVPILGSVTCHEVMFPQLRGALREIVARGLAHTIHPSEYGGCYVPRFIGSNPSNPVSLHTWGIAIDINVPGNRRGTRGQIDRRVVAIFKKWGFAWGGDWSYSDPMHFELAGILRRPG